MRRFDLLNHAQIMDWCKD